METLDNLVSLPSNDGQENTSKQSLEQHLDDAFQKVKNEKLMADCDSPIERIVGQLLANVHDLKYEFLQTKGDNTIGVRGKIRFLAVREITYIIAGAIQVFNYEERMKTKQEYFLWNGTYWCRFTDQQFQDFAKEACKRMNLDEHLLHDHKFMLTLIENVAFEVAHMPNSKIPQDEAWINFLNGTLEIHADGTTTFREHRPGDYFLYTLNYEYDPSAGCGQWNDFLDQMLSEKEAQMLLSEFIAYCLTENLKMEKALLLQGDGSNGKSVVMEVIEALFGIENVSNVSLNDLTMDAEKRLMIENKRVNISYENGKEIEPSILKRIISGEPIDARKLYVGSHIMRHYGKLIASFNQMPRAEVTGAFYRRLIIMPFLVTITEDKADKELPKKLCMELPGILNWVLAGLKRLLTTKKFTDSPLCNKAMLDYKLQSDNVRLFQMERLEMNYTYETEAKVLYKEYKSYCIDGEMKPVGRNNFLKRLEHLGATRYEHNRNISFNVKLISDDGKPF